MRFPIEKTGDEQAAVAAVRERRRAWVLRTASVAAPVPSQRRGRAGDWSVNVERLDRERLLRGWTLGELARVAHVDPGTLGDMVAHRRRPMVGTVQTVCAALDLTLADLLVFPDRRDRLSGVR